MGPWAGTDASSCLTLRNISSRRGRSERQIDLGLESGRKLEARRSRTWIEEPGAAGTGLALVLASRPLLLAETVGLWLPAV